MTTRRSFIRQGLLAGGGLLLSTSAIGRMMTARRPRVIIIGAGFAGLAAAWKLRKRNIDVVVLESRSRIGGRVFSRKMDEDLVIELGAEWVGNSHERIQALCAEMNLELFNNQMSGHLLYKGQYSPAGTWDYSEAWRKQFRHMMETWPQMSDQDRQLLDRTDWWHYLQRNGCDGRDLDIRELLDSTDFGESIRHVSAFAAMSEYAESSLHNEMDLKIRGGNGQLAHSLAMKIEPERILLKHSVTRIEQGDNVKVYCENGAVFTADKLICTIPAFSVNKIDWQPGLPEDQVLALSELQYVRINKHAMRFSERFWGYEDFDMVTDQLPHYFYHATKNQHAEKGVLIAYSGGDKAAVIANQSYDWMAQQVADTLSLAWDRRKILSLLERQENYYWGMDEYSRGAYALYGVNQWFRLRPVLSRPFLHTVFAGEHLAEWQGFMEGAVVTGENAADEI